MDFRYRLQAAQKRTNSWLCVGLDPDPERMPDLPALRGAEGLAAFCRQIIEATSDLVCAYKPNLAFFLAHGAEGIQALEETLKAVPSDTPIVLDAKVGDIGNTQRMYGRAVYDRWGVDAVTVSPYVGEDAILPLIEAHPRRGVYVLCRSSNPGSERFQAYPGQPPYLYERVAEAARGWAAEHPESVIGLVVGATYPDELASLREQAPELPFLIPGIGAQGGTLEAAVRFGASGLLGPLISVSRAVNYASSGPDYAEAAREAALRLRDRINRLRNESK